MNRTGGILLGALFLGLLGCRDTNAVESRAALPALFARPLIAGASISADWGTLSPGKRLSHRYTSPSEVVTVASGGATSRAIEPRLTPEVLAGRSVIVAIDLFFWDSASDSVAESEARLESLLAKGEARVIPVVLGDIPELLPGRQPSRDALNAALRARCLPSKQCYLLELDALYRQIRRDGFLEIEGKRHPLRALLPDGLHLSDLSSEYLANRIAQLLR